jgi:flagellar biosynthesis/type III secretory pathway chaperone
VLISELVQRIGALEEHAKQNAQQNATLVQQNVQLCQELANVKKGVDKSNKVRGTSDIVRWA